MVDVGGVKEAHVSFKGAKEDEVRAAVKWILAQ
jgi:hypothetical protein